ncbi:MAG: CDP-archaeol synthase [Nanoarchaeota archaeon]|nr:CDP-archaeol synthase [Nanoarchaeota archaeon]
MSALLELFWVFLPAGIANICPSISAKWLPGLSYPLDFGRTFRGRRIFGEHKTIRGIIAGVMGGGAVFLLEKYLLGSIAGEGVGNLPWYFGFLLGAGAVGGDAIESFFKRQIGMRPGKSWILFDQIDWIVGALIASRGFVIIALPEILLLVGAGGLLHFLVKLGGYMVRIEKTPI